MDKSAVHTRLLSLFAGVVEDEGLHPVGRINSATAGVFIVFTSLLMFSEGARSAQAMTLKVNTFEWVITVPAFGILCALMLVVVSLVIIRDNPFKRARREPPED